MLYRNLILGLRRVLRDRIYTLVTVGGLATGMAASLLIYLWVLDEINYDDFHVHGENIYKIITRHHTDPDVLWTTSPLPLAPGLSGQYPEIEAYTRTFTITESIIYRDKIVRSEAIMLVDPAFLDIFTFELLAGNPSTVLSSPGDIVITETVSQKLFGGSDPVGRMVMAGEKPCRISGVLKDPPTNSVLQFDALGHIGNLPEQRLQSWTFAENSYILLREGVNPGQFERKIKGIYQELDEGSDYYPLLQNIRDVYLYQHAKPGRIMYVLVFSLIALIIILVACINFMNLAVARYASRTLEFAVRKAIGASRMQIIRQVLVETILAIFMAVFLAIILLELFGPEFNLLTGKQIDINFSSPGLVTGLVVVFILTLIVSGSYPAILTAAFSPATIMQQTGPMRMLGKGFISLLVIFQFFISITLIICAFFLTRQWAYIRDKNLGYGKEQIMVLWCNSELRQGYDKFKAELLKLPGVEYVTATTLLPNDITWRVELDWEGNPDGEVIPVEYLMVDYDFIEAMDMKMVEGRSFSPAYPSDDSISYIINETAARMMGEDDLIGKQVEFLHPDFPERFRKGYIIGIVGDFIFRPLREKSAALVMRMYRPWYGYVLIKIGRGDLNATVEKIENTTRKLFPDYPYEHRFFDESFDGLYRSEMLAGKIIRYFAFLSILISMLGLFGQTAFQAEKRTKEIAIRKINGGSFEAILRLLLLDFTRRIMIAVILAIPVSILILKRVVSGYADHAPISIWIFILATLTAVLIAGLTVIYHAYLIARRNPVESLRYE